MADGIRTKKPQLLAKPTFLMAMNKVRKEKGKSTLAGKALATAGPKTIERLANKADKRKKR